MLKPRDSGGRSGDGGLFPKVVMAKAQMLGKAGFLNVVLVMSFLVGAYFTWFGYAGLLAGG